MLNFIENFLFKIDLKVVSIMSGGAHYGSSAGSGFFYSNWVRSGSLANVGFFTTVKLD